MPHVAPWPHSATAELEKNSFHMKEIKSLKYPQRTHYLCLLRTVDCKIKTVIDDTYPDQINASEYACDNKDLNRVDISCNENIFRLKKEEFPFFGIRGLELQLCSK